MSDQTDRPARARTPRTHDEEFWRDIPVLEKDNLEKGATPEPFRKRNPDSSDLWRSLSKKPAPKK